MDRGSTDVSDLATIIDEHRLVDVRLVLIRRNDGWQVMHGEVTLDGVVPAQERTWRYPEEVFLERRLPGGVIGALLRKEPQDLAGYTVSTPPMVGNGIYSRLAGQTEWRHGTMPWPRTEWEISRGDSLSSRHGNVLVGDGPAFVSFEAAFSAFFYRPAPTNMASQQPVWRVIQLDRRAWLHRVTITPDTLKVV
jgi:hypothetical protein